MERKDGEEGFEHQGIYDQVVEKELIAYTLTDGRKSVIKFIPEGATTIITEYFEPEQDLSRELQKNFCQSVLNRFKKYVEEQERK